MAEVHSERIAAPGIEALTGGAGLIPQSPWGHLFVTGRDRVSYLHGLLTNDIEALGAGEGCYAALLTAQGRMITDMRVFNLEEGILIEVPRALASDVRTRLERFVFSEDVQVADQSTSRAELGVYGPKAADTIAALCGDRDAAALERMPMLSTAARRIADRDVLVIRSDSAGVAGFDLIVKAEDAEALAASLRAAGAVDVDDASAEIVRIEAGIPRFGVDMNEETIPLEAGIEARAISRTKGCYPGQEVIVRVLDRGHGRVARRLVRLLLPEGAATPAPGTPIRSGDREIGRITSAAWSPSHARPIALGYVHRDFTEGGTRVDVAGVDAEVRA